MSRPRRRLPPPIIRMRWVVMGLLAIYACLGLRLLKIQFFDHDELARRAAEQQTKYVRYTHARGGIFDRNGEPLVIDYPGWDLCVRIRGKDKRVPPLAERIAILSRAFGVDEAKIRRKFAKVKRTDWIEFRRGVQDPGIVGFQKRHPHWTSISRRNLRLHPLFPLAEGLLGRAGARGKDNRRNLVGLEAVLDPYLASQDSLWRSVQDARHTAVDFPGRVRPIEQGRTGADVVLTLDREVQEVVEMALDGIVDAYNPGLGTGAVVLDADSGEVLALASRPRCTSLRRWQYDGDGTLGSRPWMVPLTQALSPGSVFKPFTIGYAIDRGLVDLRDEIDCGHPVGKRGRVKLSRRYVRNFKDKLPGTVSVAESLYCSYNIGLARIGERLGVDGMVDLFGRLGFERHAGGPLQLALPAPWRSLRARPGSTSQPKDWRPGYSDVAWSFGQEMRLSLVQIAHAYTAIATDGVMRTPVLVKSIRYADGRERPSPFVAPRRRLFSPEIAASLRATLENAFLKRGGTLNSIYRRSPEMFEGVRIAAKTGTATGEDPRVRKQRASDRRWRRNSENVLNIVMMGQREAGGGRYVVAFTAPHPQAKNKRYVSAGKVLGNPALRVMRFLLDRDARSHGKSRNEEIATRTTGRRLRESQIW